MILFRPFGKYSVKKKAKGRKKEVREESQRVVDVRRKNKKEKTRGK